MYWGNSGYMFGKCVLERVWVVLCIAGKQSGNTNSGGTVKGRCGFSIMMRGVVL